MLHLAHRIYSLLDDVKKDDQHVYLLVAHNGIIEWYFHDMTTCEEI